MPEMAVKAKYLGFPFRDENVLAIKDNRKTQTRRLMYPQPPRGLTVGNISADGVVLEWILCDSDGDEVDKPCAKPALKVGDWMWVKEVYQEFCPLWDGAWCGHGTQEGMAQDHYMVYRADNPDGAFVWKGEVTYCLEWKLTDMPRRCARFFRQITDVKAERVADISEEDAIAEGFGVSVGFTSGGAMGLASARYVFKREWDKIHGRESWERNDWVWAYTFAPGSPRPLPARTEYAGW